MPGCTSTNPRTPAARNVEPASARSVTETAAAQAASDDLGSGAQLLVHHLLTGYAAILPGNPRLIIRVASAWAMLRAVGRSLDLEVDTEPENEIVARAAVTWVRFPVLVDELLDAHEPPVTDPHDPDCQPRWRRRDVQHVLTMNNGNRMDIRLLANYYGKYVPPTSADTRTPTRPDMPRPRSATDRNSQPLPRAAAPRPDPPDGWPGNQERD